VDYRNIPFKFGFGGLNIVASPENLGEGQYSYFQNVRYKRLGTLEGRPGTEDFLSQFDQPTVGVVTTPYPQSWNVGELKKIHYIGKVFHTPSVLPEEIDGWLTIHADGFAGLNNATEYVTFINGVPVAKMETGCTVWPALKPTGFSVVRATAKSGVPITLIDGTHFIINKEANHTSPNATIPNYNYGTYAGNTPVFYAYRLGITPPTTAPSVAVSVTGSGLTGDYTFAYTYYSTVTGFESAQSPATATVTGFAADTAAFTNVNVSTDPQVNTIRYWRKGGTLSLSWRLVGTTPNNPCAGGTTTFNDANTDATIAVAEAFNTDLVAPFSSIANDGTAVTQQKFNYCWGPFQGKYNFWVGDPVKKGYIYWNYAGELARYNPLTSLTAVSDPGEELQNGFLFSSVPFVFSKLNLYGLDFGGPDALPEFSPRLIPIGMGLAGKWAFAVGPNTVYFLGRDGIYATDCQPGRPTSLTEDRIKPIFQGYTVNGIPPIDWSLADSFRMAVTPKELHFFYISSILGGGRIEQVHLVLDLERNAWIQWTSNKYSSAYHDEGAPSNRVLFGTSPITTTDKTIYFMDDARPMRGTETFTVHARTGTIDSGIPLTYKEYGVLQLDADYDATSVSITPYYNSEITTGTLFYAEPDITDTRKDYSYSLSDTYARSISLDISWIESPAVIGSLSKPIITVPAVHPVLYQGNLLFREDEESLIHWEQPPSSLGHSGWFHLKDSYICLRSDSEVTLTVIIDNTTTDTYPIATTAGARLKRYIEFKPRRGKVYQFKLDSIGQALGTLKKPFRFYGEESLLNGKPWITGTTYEPITPFGNVGYAQYRRTEGGT